MSAASISNEGRSICLDRLPYDKSAPPAVPEPYPESQAERWRFYFPWVKTAVSAPTYNGHLVIANQTNVTWLLWHNYHSLGLIDPECERQVRLVRAGTISARLLVADASSEYLLLALAPEVLGVELVNLAAGNGLYTLRPTDTGTAALSSLPDSTSIRELHLSPKTVRALERIGVATTGQLRRADLGLLWEVKHGNSAYAELISMLFRQRSRVDE